MKFCGCAVHSVTVSASGVAISAQISRFTESTKDTTGLLKCQNWRKFQNVALAVPVAAPQACTSSIHKAGR
jgi:hypothetical protein